MKKSTIRSSFLIKIVDFSHIYNKRVVLNNLIAIILIKNFLFLIFLLIFKIVNNKY